MDHVTIAVLRALGPGPLSTDELYGRARQRCALYSPVPVSDGEIGSAICGSVTRGLVTDQDGRYTRTPAGDDAEWRTRVDTTRIDRHPHHLEDASAHA